MNARRHDVVTIPTIRVAFVVSLLVHAALLWLALPHLRALTQSPEHRATSPLAVDLVPRKETIASAASPARPATPPATSVAPSVAQPTPVPRKRPPQPSHAAPKAPPPVITRRAPSPAPLEARPNPPSPPNVATESQPSPASPPAVKPPPMPVAPAQDLASYVEARRRARGEAPAATGAPSASAESDIARRDRIVAANLGLDRTPSFGTDARNAGGLFQITELGYDDARFYFLGFDKAIGRNARQLIEVRKGAEPDIRVAIVRRMIAIIRESINGDFVWMSQRQGRGITLSSRPEDNAGLEDFILRDIFPDARP